jgi:hypothetical protein
VSLSPEMEAAYEGPGFIEFAALKVEFPDKTIRLVDGSGVVKLGLETYEKSDSDYGVWASGDDIADGIGGEAPRFRFTLKVPDPAIAQAMVLPGSGHQMSPVTVTTGLVDPMTGLALPGWETEFLGFFDTARRTVTEEEDSVACDSFSAMEFWFRTMDGRRLSSAWLKSRYPTAKGLDHMKDVRASLPWGVGGAGTAFKGSVAGDWDWRKIFIPSIGHDPRNTPTQSGWDFLM